MARPSSDDASSAAVRHRPIRIAFVVTRYAAGGLERCVAHLVNRLPADQFAPEIVSFGDLGSAPDWVTREQIMPVSMNKRAGNDLRLVFRLARWLKANQIQIAHSHNWGTLVETSLACRLAGVVHVHAEHSQQDRLGTATAGLRREAQAKLRRFAFRKCGAVVACAETVRQGIEEQWAFPAASVVTIPNGVQRPASGVDSQVRQSLGIADSAILVGSVGRLEALKGFDTLIRATKELVDSGIDVHTVIVGDGPQQQSLQQLIVQCELGERVHLVGYHANVGDWMSAMDVYVNCSHTEAMSMSILEAMSCRLPIVASDVGDSSILVQSRAKCGMVVPAGDPVCLARSLAQYAGDPPLRNRHGASSECVYENHYTLDHMIQGYRKLYMRLLSVPERQIAPGGHSA
ncbi:glycosyltransferase [Allorhodopirellula heiligendammensis]|uniref:Alpha-D-kanosaminyltransferase n=1 Tax=Allorhodopirellula heiligendammensis TaxID=2714739 RepID=A0A5C6CB07_9BACT|nr:glycosyltransferase [Allorhodopirellula heiligendammensis]TWU19999.1 Alpha-D-kanosaminyltransferase [Allorhodopirellula heiligendammensis]